MNGLDRWLSCIPGSHNSIEWTLRNVLCLVKWDWADSILSDTMLTANGATCIHTKSACVPNYAMYPALQEDWLISRRVHELLIDILQTFGYYCFDCGPIRSQYCVFTIVQLLRHVENCEPLSIFGPQEQCILFIRSGLINCERIPGTRQWNIPYTL